MGLTHEFEDQGEDIEQDERGHRYDARWNGEPFDIGASDEWQAGWREADKQIAKHGIPPPHPL